MLLLLFGRLCNACELGGAALAREQRRYAAVQIAQLRRRNGPNETIRAAFNKVQRVIP